MKKCRKLKYGFLPIILMYAIGFLFFGCSQTNSIVDRKMPTGIQERDKIAVVINTKPYFRSSPNDKTIFTCISHGFTKLKLEEKLVPADNFRNIAFSDISLSENSDTKEAIEHIIINSSVLEKVKSKGIRYIVLVGEPKDYKQVNYEDSGWDVAASPYGAAPFYYKEKSTQITFWIHGEIFDINGGSISGYISTHSSGESYYFLVPPLGYGWPSTASQSKACEDFGEAVVNFIIGRKTDE